MHDVPQTNRLSTPEPVIREIDLARDREALESVDGSFTTDRIYRLSVDGLRAHFVEEILKTPLTKRYDLTGVSSAVEESSLALIAESVGSVAGFITAKYEAWNRRLRITHLYVEPAFRGSGVGSRFIGETEGYGGARKARGLWLETQNFNYPAIQFYLKLGFRFCGFDASLYDPSVVPGETAMYFMRDI